MAKLKKDWKTKNLRNTQYLSFFVSVTLVTPTLFYILVPILGKTFCFIMTHDTK